MNHVFSRHYQIKLLTYSINAQKFLDWSPARPGGGPGDTTSSEIT
jgi:hypothetical protein